MRGALFLSASSLCGLVWARFVHENRIRRDRSNGRRNLAPAPHGLRVRDVDPEDLYPAHNISVPVDHFHNDSRYEPHSDEYFNLRYFFDATYYRPGGPVIVLQSGETDATGRLPFLQKGIVYQLASALHGIGVVLEHRYYGTSFPVPDLSTENMRFLSTDQAVADQAYFASHIVFPGLEHLNLTAPGTPYLAYGGSYAGGVVAFLRLLYPDLTWGAISSSGVTKAIYDYWEYYEPLREYAPAECIATQVKLINIIDNILLKNDSNTVAELKAGFGMESLTYSNDFANLASAGIGWWQSRNWSPDENSPEFDYYCGNITSDSILWPGYVGKESTAVSLIEAGGWGNESTVWTNRMLNWMAWISDSYVGDCEDTLDECYSYNNASAAMYTDKDISNYNALSWSYQYCTEWGYIQTGSGVPADRLPLISRLLTLEYLTQVCRYAFNITSRPDVDAVNKYGGFNISYPRLAIIGGEADPWRPATPLATLDIPDRLNDTSTASEPIILIPGAIHHWDENGLFPNETSPELPPPSVADAQNQLVQAAQEWMMEWAQSQL
ncbi:uncharacterized protein Z518_00052 [Rhinocladiella mackenziei CBS 650.93]|uniref:Uncharacterized protein n=1 Tax=Rhinocladiella mackenziei CBS 650.93 TaxID=1442369 RepID=A0A0D2ISM7_9EURO|nr:uncharacterized protein Z518_00052 [Rhinocladiella mackenziei CBS 650.93]KIX08974.1 hypothetical protein Z518_00052 [Rhinocladiella mackenziei CBS 650.93]